MPVQLRSNPLPSLPSYPYVSSRDYLFSSAGVKMTAYDEIAQTKTDDELKAWVRKLVGAGDEVVAFVDARLDDISANILARTPLYYFPDIFFHPVFIQPKSMSHHLAD